jgi:endo-1,4-beta-xylanase
MLRNIAVSNNNKNIHPIKNNKMRFTGPITNNKIKAAVLALALFSTSFSACKKSADEDFTPQESATSTETVISANDLNETALKGSYHLKDYTLKGVFKFPIGAAVVKELLERPEYANTLIKDFSRLSSESDFKWGSVHPSKDKYTFAKADAIVAFAQKHKMKVHGHTLLWAHDGNEPKWVKEFQGDKAAWEKLMKDHIYTVMRHFKGQVQSWDVVNEAVKEGGVYTNSIWYRKLGKDYVIKAFKYAQEADPSAKLFLNDYGQEYGGKKMKELLSIVDEAKKQGVTIHGMGFQLHTVLRMEAKLIANTKCQILSILLMRWQEHKVLNSKKSCRLTWMLSLRINNGVSQPGVFQTKPLTSIRVMQTAITITHYYSVKITKPNGLTEALSKQVLEDILDHSKQKRSNKNYREGGSAVSRLLFFV